jgi:phosphate transport system substrate-binding protein
MHKSQASAERAKDVLKFFEWAYANGDAMALELVYIPLPDTVVNQIQAAWKSQIKDQSGKSVW